MGTNIKESQIKPTEGVWEINKVSGRVSSAILWSDATKTVKKKQIDYTRVGGRVTQIVETLFDGGDQVVTCDITRVNGRIDEVEVTVTDS